MLSATTIFPFQTGRRFLNRLLLFLVLLPAVSRAQFHQFRNYNVADGLPSSEVYAMMQDASGYIWFTTDMGVSRFDGYTFRNFSTENGMPDNTIFGVQQDRKGRVWFRSFSGQLCYFSGDRMHSLPCNAAIAMQMTGAMMTSLYVDDGDTIWAGTNKNFVLKILPGWKTGDVKRIEMASAVKGYLCQFDRLDFIFGGGLAGGYKMDVYHRLDKKLYGIQLFDTSWGKNGIRFSVTRLSGGDFVVTAHTAIARFNSAGLLSQNVLTSIGICTLEDGDGSILAATYDGVIAWRDQSFRAGSRIPKLDQKIVTGICRDRENGLWFCTEGNGVFYIPQRSFMYYTPADGLSESKISCVSATGGTLVAGHLDGTVSVMNGASVHSFFPATQTGPPGHPNRLTSVLCRQDGSIFASSVNGTYSLDVSGRSAGVVGAGSKKIISSADGNTWSLRFRYIAKYEQHSFRELKRIPLDVFADNIYEDRSGKLWVCAINGLWVYEDATGLVYLGKDNPLLASRIVDLQETPGGSTWMASRGNGVIVKKGTKFFSITQKDGLAGNMCRSLLTEGNVTWVGTNNGLSRITVTSMEPFRYEVSTYTSRNGLLTDEVNNIVRLQEKLCVVHNNGITVLDPKELLNNTTPPPVYITATLVNGDSVSGETHSFGYDRNYFNFQFTGLSFKDPGAIEYKYKMEGIDSGWVYTPYTSVKYQTIPPGDYRFVVYARNNDGYWSRDAASMAFTILPPWWQTWWFKLLAISAGLLLVLLIFKMRLGKIRERDRKKAALQNRIAAIELTALRAQMNPHFVFNAINSVQYFITNNDPDSSQKYLSKFARLIRYVLDNSKLTTIPVQKELDALTLYLDLEALRFAKRFSYTITVHPGVDREHTQIPSMLIQPYVENAIWHGIMHKTGEGCLEIGMEMKGNVLKCSIEDNGIGRKKSLELKQEKETAHRSVGMSNTKERLEIINQVNNTGLSVTVTDLYDPSGEGCGTRVEIDIPCN